LENSLGFFFAVERGKTSIVMSLFCTQRKEIILEKIIFNVHPEKFIHFLGIIISQKMDSHISPKASEGSALSKL